jgi:hypothetical protein
MILFYSSCPSYSSSHLRVSKALFFNVFSYLFQVVTKVAYVVLGITMDGYKEILGIWIEQNERPSASTLCY